MNLIFDTHAHYDDEAFDADREALLASMPENGVGLIVDPGCDLDTSRRAVEIAEQYPHVYAAVGWHPENCAPYTRESLDTLRAWAKNPKVVAIGEIENRLLLGAKPAAGIPAGGFPRPARAGAGIRSPRHRARPRRAC